MRVGINLWVWVSPFDSRRDLARIRQAKALGAQAVEFALEEDAVVDPKAVRALLTELDLDCSVIGLFGPARNFASLEASVREAGLEYLRRSIDITAEAGAKLFSGAVWGVGETQVLSAAEREERAKFAAESLNQAAEYSARSGVRFCAEVLNRYESNFCNTAAESRALIERAGHPNAGLHLDTFHMSMEETSLAEAIRSAGPKLFHLHSSESQRGAPGDGMVRWDQVMPALRGIGYQGSLVLESFHPAGRLAPLARAWRSYAENQDELAARGLRFLNRLAASPSAASALR
ncbi:MAG: sugar phosphate isomerase/epimerase [Acidobacteria bacterium]|nr:sugar phosphate isomerase/epimerase [Acidobacteriota bacterium]